MPESVPVKAPVVEIDDRVMLPCPMRAAVSEMQPMTLHDSERLHILQALERGGWRIYGPLGPRIDWGFATLSSRIPARSAQPHGFAERQRNSVQRSLFHSTVQSSARPHAVRQN